MAIGERIRYIRKLRGMTQKLLGMMIGFNKRTADIRIAQYESGTRTPKGDMVNLIADALDVRSDALNVPNIDTDVGLMHTFFALEDIYGFKPDLIDYHYCIIPNGNDESISKGLRLWYEEAQKLQKGEITKEEYDAWRYTFPEIEARQNKEAILTLMDKEKKNSSK